MSASPIPFKCWCAEEAMREKVSPRAIVMRISRGKYPWLVLKRVNQRVIYVDAEKSCDWMGEGAFVVEAK